VGSMAFLAMFVNAAMATNHTVGAPRGSWDATTNLQAWAKSKTFSAGDNLSKFSIVFIFNALYTIILAVNPSISSSNKYSHS